MDSCMRCTLLLRAPLCCMRDPRRAGVEEVAHDGDLKRVCAAGGAGERGAAILAHAERLGEVHLEALDAAGGRYLAVEAGLTARVQQPQAHHAQARLECSGGERRDVEAAGERSRTLARAVAVALVATS